MGCNKCGSKNGCGCGNNQSGQMANMLAQLADFKDQIDTVLAATDFLINGHPIIEMQNADDIALFDSTTKMGSAHWTGWALCVGQTHYSPKHKKNITTPNLVDRFVVMAGGTYAVDATGGANTVALVTAELPAHNHGVIDPGHTHTITDPGHTHAVNDDQHTHAFTGAVHTHTFTTSSDGDHTHNSRGSILTGPDDGSLSAPNLNVAGTSFQDHNTAGAHTHTGTTDEGVGGGTVGNAATGIEIVEAITGATNASNTTGITIANAGNGNAHENRPPYYSLYYIMKIF